MIEVDIIYWPNDSEVHYYNDEDYERIKYNLHDWFILKDIRGYRILDLNNKPNEILDITYCE